MNQLCIFSISASFTHKIGVKIEKYWKPPHSSDTFPETNQQKPLKTNDWNMKFPFGFRPIFRGLLVSLRDNVPFSQYSTTSPFLEQGSLYY